jgi:2-polyprenyl-3-methyl-5-hydroxy-6-metoxy-1,4-benzoquinol methylase
MKRAENALELMDRPLPGATLAASLADIERLNAWFGGHRLTLRELTRVVRQVPRDRRLTVLDVGGGRGDLALRLLAWARGQGRTIRVILLERDAGAIALARQHCAGAPEIVFIQADAAAMPLREGGVDVAVSALTLHHLEPDAAASMLGEMRAAASRAVIVNDLLRTRVAWVLVWLATRLFARHPISRHDGPLSVRRSYSADEIATLAEKAGVGRFTVRRYRGLARLLFVATGPG